MSSLNDVLAVHRIIKCMNDTGKSINIENVIWRFEKEGIHKLIPDKMFNEMYKIINDGKEMDENISKKIKEKMVRSKIFNELDEERDEIMRLKSLDEETTKRI